MLRTWNGGDNGFRVGGNWSPSGRPTAGDDLTVAEGTAKLRNGSFGSADAATSIHLTGTADTPATLTVVNATLTNVHIDELTSVPNDNTVETGTLVIKGQVVNDGGSIDAAGSLALPHTLDVELRPGATLVNEGGMGTFPGAVLNVDGPDATLENDGSISAEGGTVTISAHLTGTGTLYAGELRMLNAKIELAGAVDAGQTARLGQGVLQINAPQQFLGSVDLPASSGFFQLEGLNAASWATDGNVLELFNACGGLADTVRLTPQANPVDLQVSAFTDPTYGPGVRVSAVPAGLGSDTPGALPSHDFVPIA